MQTVNLLLSAILQVLLASILPLVFWLIFARKETGFFRWLGLKKPVIQNKGTYIVALFTVLVLFSILSFLLIPHFVSHSVLAASQFSGKGISALIPALIYAFVQTGFSEELFFRGFLAKRLIHRCGFQAGNFIQGTLFGLMHVILFATKTSTLGLIVIFTITGTVGCLLGWINEKLSNGSIVSSWLLHGCVNTFASVGAMFSIL